MTGDVLARRTTVRALARRAGKLFRRPLDRLTRGLLRNAQAVDAQGWDLLGELLAREAAAEIRRRVTEVAEHARRTGRCDDPAAEDVALTRALRARDRATLHAELWFASQRITQKREA